jgi:probable rRNA maturation factor
MIRIRNETGAALEDAEIPEVLEHTLAEHLGAAEAESTSLDLMILTDGAIVQMNAQYRGTAETTDVLAFEDGQREDDTGLQHLGDVAINLSAAERESQARSVPLREELLLYAVHGTLHLLGYDDEREEEASQMRIAEREALAPWGIHPDWG